jgi:outer membrane receptor protein involved in Fe transport
MLLFRTFFQFVFLVTWIALTTSTINAFAQTSDLANLSLEELMDIKVTSASKKAEIISDAPAAVTVITSEDIRLFGYRTLAETLTRVPGFYVSNDRNYEYLGVRGIARPGDYNTRILLLVDGHRINDPVYDYAPIAEEFPVDIQDIDRIEIIKGPGSSLWGTNALLGVINVITKTGGAIDGTVLTGEYGTFRRRKGVVQLGKKLDNGAQIAASVSTLTNDGEENTFFPEFNQSNNNLGVAQNRDDELARKASLRASLNGTNFEFFTKERDKTVPTGAYGTRFNSPLNTTRDVSTHVELNTNQDISKDFSMLIRAYADRVSYKGVFDFSSGDNDLINDDQSRSTLYGTELRLSNKLSKDASLIYGVEYQDHSTLSLTNKDIIPTTQSYLDLDSSRALLSFYSQLEYELKSNLKIVGGIRSDDYSTSAPEFSPRGAILYTLDNDTTFKGMLGRAFRIANFYESNYRSALQLQNTSLKPERIYSYELAVEHRINKYSRISFNLFTQELDEIITQTQLDDSMTQFQNLNSAQSKGIEVQYDLRIKDGIKMFFAGSLISTENGNTNQQLTNAPQSTVTSGISIPLIGEKWSLAPQVQFTGSRKTISDETIGGMTSINATVLGNDVLPNLDLSFGAYNLFDRELASPGAEEHVQSNLPLYGRTVRAQATYHF